jgi:hypothetical protein
VAYLEKLKKAVLLLDRHLEEKNVIKLGFYSYLDGAITGGDPFRNALLASGELRPFYMLLHLMTRYLRLSAHFRHLLILSYLLQVCLFCCGQSIDCCNRISELYGVSGTVE